MNATSELKYTVRGADGNTYGPATLNQITAWIQEGRVRRNHEVQRSDMEHWVPAEDFEEFKTAFPQSAQSGPATAVAEGAGRAQAAAPADAAATVAQMRSGGSWFFWIAGLSLVNTISALSGSDWRFIVGLGITQVFDAFASEMSGSGKAVALVLDFLAAGMFVGFGVFANKGHGWSFIVGMVLFALDGLILLLVQDWIGIAFHAFVLYCLFRGYSACRRLRNA